MERKAAAARFLDRDMPEQYLQEWTAHVATAKNVVEAGTKSVLIFRIGAEWLALPTGLFQEVMERSVVRTLPDHRGGILRGLVNVRGELLLCVSLEPLLGMEGANAHQRLMVYGAKDGRFAFWVNEIEGVSRYHPKDLWDVPATLSNAAGAYILGVLSRKDKTIGILDQELLFFALNKGLA